MSNEVSHPPRPVVCARCSTNMEYKGTKEFHEGTQYGVFGDLGELFENKEKFDVYTCPKCGVVEFFVDQVGEDMRPN